MDWSAGDGTIKLFYRGRLKRKRIDRAIERLVAFRDLIDPELYAVFADAEPNVHPDA
ncbi:MAG: hypothetical protein ACI89L_000577 [Phycisphaerales bacterium]